MKIVIISEYATRELYVIEQIIKEYPSTVVVQPVYASEHKKRESLSIKKRIQQFFRSISWKIHRELWNHNLYPDKNYPDIPHTIYVPSSKLNEKAGIEIIKELSPDVLLTCRAPILKPEVIQIPEIAALNIHYGIAPYYRGNDTLFWPLYYEDFEHLGGSIHHLTEGIDTGNIVAEVYPELTPADGEVSVDCKTTRLLGKTIVQFLKSVENSTADITGKPQTVPGKNFKSKDRTLSISLKYVAKRALGFSRPPWRSEKSVTYFNESTNKKTLSGNLLVT